MVDRILIEDGYLVIKVKEFYAYNIAMDWLDTKEKVVEWVEHLNKKKWFTDDDLDCLRYKMKEIGMDAYYYGFIKTGVRCIDEILSAVAMAGKAYHNTADWNDADDGEQSPVEKIQRAANNAAKVLK